MRRLVLLLPCFLAVSCVSGYIGAGRDAGPDTFTGSGWVKIDIQEQRQTQVEDCGSAVMAMVLTRWRDPVTVKEVTELLPPTPSRGTQAGDMRDFAKKRGFVAFVFPGTIEDLRSFMRKGCPPIVGMVKPHLQGSLTHYEVVMALNEDRKEIGTMDPARGLRIYPIDGFIQEWTPAKNLILLVTPAEKPPPDTSK